MDFEEVETARRGVRIWFEDEFDQIEAVHKKELAELNSELVNKDSEIASKDSEIASKDAQIAKLELILKENGII